MTRYRIPIAIALFFLPIIARLLWFHQGIFWRVTPVATPDYASQTIPKPPLSTPIPDGETAVAASSSIILLDESHNNWFSPTEIDSLTGILNARNARVEVVSSGGYQDRDLSEQLKYATAYITICPTESFSLEETQMLQSFVARGGRLLVLTDPTRSSLASDFYGSDPTSGADDVNAANSLLAPFDIAFVDDYLYNMTENEGNFRNVVFQTFSDDAFTNGFGKIVLYAAHSVQTRTGVLIMTGSAKMLSSRTDTGDELSAGAIDSGNRVLAIGDMTFLQPPYNQVADNPVLIRHMADFLLEAERAPTLAEFPFLFQKPVSIVPLKDVDLDADLLGPINALQEELAVAGITTRLAPSPREGEDLILLGTYSSDGIEDYLQTLGITLPSVNQDEGPRIQIPGFGGVKPNGTGLILLVREKARTTLLLLAVDTDSLTSLMDVIGPIGFSDCILQGDVAVCGIGSASGGYDNSWWNPTEDTSGMTPTPAPIDLADG